jgi:hypothetical protein
MKIRPDMLDENSPSCIEIFQLTQEDIPSSHVYMEAQIFTLDSKRFVLHRAASAHSRIPDDPEHQYFLCDIENRCECIPLTEDPAAIAPSVSPDGQFLYYFIDKGLPDGGSVILERVNLDGTGRQVITDLDSGIPGDGRFPSRIYPLSTISSDGKRLAVSAFLGNGTAEDAPYGLLVFDLETGNAKIIIEGPSWCNIHPQYSRSPDPVHSHDILIQENHGNTHDPEGSIVQLTGGNRADIHVIQDDGSDFRTMPWGRDGNEFCQGHQCWRGRSGSAITSTNTKNPPECQLIEGWAVDNQEHNGINTPDGKRNDLSKEFPDPGFAHFSTDINGTRLISDCAPFDKGGRIFLFDLPDKNTEPFKKSVYLCNAGSTCVKETHIHPFLSPDGTMGFFNSNESGILQAYMIKNLNEV